jgi:1,4-alpha-glucan branching enzyme
MRARAVPVETSNCCANTASEHHMMERLMVDSLVTWATRYRIDAFRFDLMGHHMTRNMEKVRAALDALTPERDGVDGRSIYLYGEGWNFGEVADGARGTNATQHTLAGTGIAPSATSWDTEPAHPRPTCLRGLDRHMVTTYGIGMSEMTKTTLYLPEADYARIKAMAAREGRSAAELVREAVAEYASRRGPRRLPRSLGAGRSGKGDVSEKAERLLKGIGRR